MKKLILGSIMMSAVVMSCSTVQSFVQNNFPYSTNFIIPSGTSAGAEHTNVSAASSFSQLFGNTSAQNYRVVNANLSVNNANDISLGVLKSVKVYLSGITGNEVLVASRSDISNNIGNNLSLDVANTGVLDDLVKSGSLKMKVVYVLKEKPATDLNLKTSLNFNSQPSQ